MSATTPAPFAAPRHLVGIEHAIAARRDAHDAATFARRADRRAS